MKHSFEDIGVPKCNLGTRERVQLGNEAASHSRFSPAAGGGRYGTMTPLSVGLGPSTRVFSA
jgi:hypothetical protein